MFRSVQKDLPKHLAEGAIVIDVRSREEYSGGHYKNSINIPLQELAMKAKDLDREKTILLCCASGARSGMAANILKSNGFKNVLNAGSWSGLK